MIPRMYPGSKIARDAGCTCTFHLFPHAGADEDGDTTDVDCPVHGEDADEQRASDDR